MSEEDISGYWFYKSWSVCMHVCMYVLSFYQLHRLLGAVQNLLLHYDGESSPLDESRERKLSVVAQEYHRNASGKNGLVQLRCACGIAWGEDVWVYISWRNPIP